MQYFRKQSLSQFLCWGEAMTFQQSLESICQLAGSRQEQGTLMATTLGSLYHFSSFIWVSLSFQEEVQKWLFKTLVTAVFQTLD